jgi:hypothetical protein
VGSDRTACAVCMPRDASLHARKVALGKFKMCNGSHTAEPPMLGDLSGWSDRQNLGCYLHPKKESKDVILKLVFSQTFFSLIKFL